MDADGISRKQTPSHDFFLHADGINTASTGNELCHMISSPLDDDKTIYRKSCAIANRCFCMQILQRAENAKLFLTSAKNL